MSELSSPANQPYTVDLDGVCLPRLLDTGASWSLLNVSTVQWVFPMRKLTTDAKDWYGYGNSKTGMVGMIAFFVCYWARALTSFTFQLSSHRAKLMGQPLQPLLNPQVCPVIQPLHRLPPHLM